MVEIEEKPLKNRSHKSGDMLKERSYSGANWEAAFSRWKQQRHFMEGCKIMGSEILFQDTHSVFERLNNAIELEDKKIKVKVTSLVHRIPVKRGRGGLWPSLLHWVGSILDTLSGTLLASLIETKTCCSHVL